MNADLRGIERIKAALRELDEVWPASSGDVFASAESRGDG